jgi:hypothetical protein
MLSPAHEIAVGDILFFHASGGHVRSEGEVVELLGVFTTAVVGTNGQILEPAGPPNTVLFRARNPGEAKIAVMGGDPFHDSKKIEFRIRVGP